MRERGEVADDEGEEADVERLLDQALQDILIGTPCPEQPGKCHVDSDQRGREKPDLPAKKAKTGIDIGRKGREEPVDDADIIHVR